MKVLVLGGTRFFGKRFVHLLLKDHHEVTILSRGNVQDDFGDQVNRLRADRTNLAELKSAIDEQTFDVVVDQICMSENDAKIAVEVFKNKTSYYVMTSTMAVYNEIGDAKESHFVARYYESLNDGTYADHKKSAEKYFTLHAPFTVSFPRFPIVLGDDDYTQRLVTQIKSIKEGRPIRYPSLESKFSFISSQDAARALYWLVTQRYEGPFNFSSADQIKIKDLVALIEKETGMKANLSEKPEDTSSYGISNDFYMNVSKSEKLGFKTQNLSEYLPELIKSGCNV